MRFTSILLVLLPLLVPSRLLADSCVGASSVPATNQRFRVDGQVDAKSRKWNYVLTDVRTGAKQTGPLPKVERHAHLCFFLSQDGKRFAVLDASAGRRLTDRFMVYSSEGKLIASLGVNDILTKDERAQVQLSTSHIHWLKHTDGKYLPEENAVRLTTVAGRRVVISLADGKLIKKQE